MNSMKMVSVIIPIYNTEEYLTDCIDSVLYQTHNIIEILLVDDGSIDKSLKICEAYASEDSRIAVIHKKNGGVSSARNVGLIAAKGEFICFVDSDDYLEPFFLEKLLDCFNTEKTLMCVSNKYLRGDAVIKIFEVQNCNHLEKDDALIRLLTLRFATSLWSCLYRKEALEGIYLNESCHYWEDIEYQFRIIQRLDRVAICEIPVYHYRDRLGSANSQILNDKVFSSLKVVELLKKHVNDCNIKLLPYTHNLHCIFTIELATKAMYNCNKNDSYNQIIKQNAKSCKLGIYKSPIVSLRNKLSIILIAYSPMMFYKLFGFAQRMNEGLKRVKKT